MMDLSSLDEELIVETIDELEYESETDLSCPICNAEFVDPEDLKQHETIHQGPQIFSRCCDFCEFTYPDSVEYAKHFRDVHLSSAKFCPVCSRVFTDFSKYKQHARKHNTTKKDYYSCSQCPSFYSDTLELERHEVEKHWAVRNGVLLHNIHSYLSSLLNINFATFISIKENGSHYICTKCEFKSNDMDVYIQHLQKKNCRSYTCDSCGKVYKLLNNMSVHLSNNSQCGHLKRNQVQQCTECLQSIRIVYFKNHVKHCKPIKCMICNIIFDSVNRLTEHQVSKHPLSIEVATCKFCLRQCVGKIALMKHMIRAHQGELNQYKYKCVECRMIFKHPQKLFAHFYGRHKDLEPYTCQICNKTFKARRRFTIHIKLQHNSEGFIEFDPNYHVFFTKTKPENPFIPTCVVTEEDRKMFNMNPEPTKSSKQINDTYKSLLNVLSGTETEAMLTEAEKSVEPEPEPPKRKRRQQKTPRKPRKRSIVVQDSSEEDEMPLVGLSGSKKPKLVPRFPLNSTLKENRKKLTCKQCNKYCYTKQNYKRHMALHNKKYSKTCIKCNEQFTSADKLTEHVNSKHQTSKLTDTLKKILEKKKLKDTPHELTMSEKFEQTIRKAPMETCRPAKIKMVKGGNIVKKFIENFTPDETKDDYSAIKGTVSIKPAPYISHIKPTIKLTKFTPEPAYTEVKLAMPVKYKPDSSEKVKVKVQLIDGPLKPSAFVPPQEETEVNEEELYDEAYSEEREEYNNIPDIAHEEEVPIETTEAPRAIHVPHKIVIPTLPPNHEVSIAHLLPEAPYFKIVKVNEVLNDVVPEPPKPEKRNDHIELPDGTKLVTVNPLAHLLGDRNVDEIMQSVKRNYKPKVISDVESALTKALEKANVPTRTKNYVNKKRKDK